MRVLSALLFVLVGLIGCTRRTLTIEVEGRGRVGERVRHGPGEVGTIESVGDPDENGLTRLQVSVDDDYVVPQGACAYAVGDAVFIRGGSQEPTESFIPRCPEGAATLDALFEEFFEDMGEQAQEGADFRDQVRRAIAPHARMARLDIPEAKPEAPSESPDSPGSASPASEDE